MGCKQVLLSELKEIEGRLSGKNQNDGELLRVDVTSLHQQQALLRMLASEGFRGAPGYSHIGNLAVNKYLHRYLWVQVKTKYVGFADILPVGWERDVLSNARTVQFGEIFTKNPSAMTLSDQTEVLFYTDGTVKVEGEVISLETIRNIIRRFDKA